jgi:mono/diheme cytochrome c family protein
MRTFTSVAAIALMTAGIAAGAQASDAATGKAVADAQCADCHEAADWQGESAANIEAMTKDIVAGTAKPQTKLKLTDAEIKAVAAYWSGAK